MAPPLVELNDIRKVYQAGDMSVPVLRGISFTIVRGEYVALMGASGSGKTTLMNILGCLDRPTDGVYRFEGRDVASHSKDELAALRSRRIGFVFQSFNLLARTSALENVLMPLSYATRPIPDREARARAVELLERVGLGDRLHHEPSQLSGGQQQRVAIARALVNSPSILFADEPTGNLDSQTSIEVLDIFRQLNEDGVTVIIVTHDEAVARNARRIIRITDGRVASEDVLRPEIPRSGDGGFQPEADAALSGSRGTVRTALTGLRRNILRAALTALGIIIGVAAVIAMMELGRGSSSSIQRAIASMGANNLIILPGTASSGGVTFGSGSVMTLSPEDVDALRREAPAIRAAAPVVRARTQVVHGNRNWVPHDIQGTTPAYIDVREWTIAEGAAFTDQDVRNAGKVCLLGQTIVRELFPGESAVGQEIRINNVPFKVVGVLGPKGANMMGMDQDDIVLAPWTTIKNRVAAKSLTNANQSGSAATTNSTSDLYPSASLGLYPVPSDTQAADTPLPIRFANVDQIVAAAVTTALIPQAIKEIGAILRERHRLRPDEPDDFNIRDMTEMTRTMSSTTVMMTRLLLAVALISLIVGGVGIMNIMLVSVTERTREIGLRMAVGARQRSILRQFLTEAVFLCISGGVVGILVGRGISFLVTLLLQWPTEISIEAITAAFAVSVTVGVVFGYYPAWKASRLDPIIALRYE